MKKIREFLSKPAVTAVLFALALLLLGSSTVAGARAALNIQSEYYNSEVEVLDIGLAVVEEQTDGSYVEKYGKDHPLMDENSPMGQIIKSDKKLLPGKTYPEKLAILNTGEIDEYVRVSVFRYWLDEDGKKFADMNSDWIEIHFLDGGKWTIDQESSYQGNSNVEERTVLYYSDPIAHGEMTEPFMDSVTINNVILTKVTQESHKEGNLTVITTTFVYNGKQFCIEVLADGVQDHNSDQAKLSAWGVNDK